MVNIGSLEAVIKLKDSLTPAMANVTKTVQKASGQIAKASAGVEKSTKAAVASTTKATAANKQYSNSLNNVRMKYLAYTVAAGVAVKLIKDTLKAQAAQVQSINSLNLALSNQGNLLPGTSERLQEYASALQGATIYGDEVILQNQALLASFGMNEEQLKSSTKVALDFASATGRDLKMAMNLLGKAFVGETGELSRYGVIIDKNIPKTERFAEVMKQLTERFGGSAQVAAQTFTGQVAQLGNALGDTQEAIGKFLGQLIGFGSGVEGATEMVKGVTKFIGQDMVIVLGEANALWMEFAAGVVNAIAWIIEKIVDFQTVFIDANRLLEKIPVIGKVHKALADGMEIHAKAGTALVSSLREEADGLDLAAKAFRVQSNAAALAVGDTIDFKNATNDAIEGAEDLADALKNRLAPDIEKLNIQLKPVIENLEELTQIDPWATINEPLGPTIASILAAGSATEKWSYGLSDLFDTVSVLGNIIGGTFGEIAETIVAAADAGRDFAAALDAKNFTGMVQAGGQAVSAMSKATGSGTRGARVAKGAMAGASFGGQAAGPWGALVGGIAGAIVGAFRGRKTLAMIKEAIRDFGTNISEELAKEIVGISKRLDIGRFEASLLKLGDIIREAGGFDQMDLSQVTLRFNDLLNAVAMGAVPAAEGLEAIADAFDEMAAGLSEMGIKGSVEMGKLIARMKELGIVTESVQSFIATQAAGAVGNLGKFFAYLAKQEKLTGDEARGALTQMTAAFQAALQATGSLVAAMEMLGPSFGELLAKMRVALGEENALLNQMSAYYNFVTENSEQLAAIEALGAAFSQLASINLINTENIGSFAASFQTEWEKLLASTGNLNMSLAAMGPQLGMLVEAYRSMGLQVPAWLQEIIDAAEEAGVAMEPPEGLPDILKDIRDIMQGIAEALGVAAGNAKNLNTNLGGIDVDVNGNGNGNGNGRRQTAQSGMFEKLRDDTVIYAHKGEFVNIVPAVESANLAIRTAQKGIPRGPRRPGPGPLPPPGTEPTEPGTGTSGGPPEIGGTGGGATAGEAKAIAKTVAREMASFMKPSISVNAPSKVEVILPELTAARAEEAFSENILPKMRAAFRNNTQGIASTIREITGTD